MSRWNPVRFPKNSEIIPANAVLKIDLSARLTVLNVLPLAGLLLHEFVGNDEPYSVVRHAHPATGHSPRNPVRKKPRIPLHFPGSCNLRVPAGRDSGPCEIPGHSQKTGSLPARTKFQRRRSPWKNFRRPRLVARAILPAHLSG